MRESLSFTSAEMNGVLADWQGLSKEELYEILRIRQEIFVLEQYCPFVDSDDLDQQAYHIWATHNDRIVGYSRVVAPGDQYQEASFGRLIVLPEYRHTGLGGDLVNASLKLIQKEFAGSGIKIMAQHYLLPFYCRYGFQKVEGKVWEDDILHYYMIKEP